MAVTVEELRAVLRMEMKPFMKDLQQLHGVSAKSSRQVENTWRQANRRLDGIGRSMARSLVLPLTGIAAAASVREVAHYADAWTIAGNKIAAAGQIAGRQGRSLEGVNEIANRTRSGITETTDLYAKLLRSTADVAKSEEEVARATEIVNKAFKAGGAAASEQTAGILQLSQALGSGLLQGDELRSLRENAPIVAQAIADEFKTTIAGLKDLGSEGKLTTDRVFKAILNAQPQIEAAFGKTNQTIADGMTRVNNALTQYIGQTDSSLSASQRIVAGLNSLADNFDETADVVLKFAAVIAGALVGRSLAMMIAKLGVGAAAIVNFVKAARTMTGLSAALSGLGAAAGPVGLLIGGAVVGSLALFASTSGEASTAARTYAEALAEVEAAANKVPAAIGGATTAIDEKMRNALTGGVDQGIAKIDEAKQAVVDLFDHMFRSVDRTVISPQQLQQLEDLRDRFVKGSDSAEGTEQALFALANSNPDFQALANAFSPLLQSLANAIAATDLLRGKLAGVGSGIIEDRSSRVQTDTYFKAREAGNAFVKEAERKNSLSKEQLAIEKEIAQIKKDAEKSGVVITENQIKALAAANVAADTRRSAEGKKPKDAKKTAQNRLDEDIQAIRDRTAALLQEQELVGKSYYEQEKRRTALDLEQEALKELREEARRKGVTDLDSIKLSNAQVAAIDAASEAYARQADALRMVEERQERIEQAASDAYDAFKTGAMDAILNAENLGDALQGVIKRLAEVALSNAFDSLFKPATGGSSGGAFGGIFGAIGKIFGFDEGGYTGDGGKMQPKGVVHGGEYVFSKAAVQKAGVANLEAMHRNLKGFASGGYVGTPSLPRIQAPANQNNGRMHVTVGVDVDGNGNLLPFVKSVSQGEAQRSTAQLGRSIPKMVDGRVDTRQTRGTRA